MAVHYRDIANDIARRVLVGEFRVGEQLPSENDLAAEYGVARGTARHALTLLGDRGTLTSHPGTRWRVGAAQQSQDLGDLYSFAQWARAHGSEPGGRVVESATDHPTVAEARQLRLNDGEDVLRVLRIRSLDGTDVMIERTTYATWMIPVIRSMGPGQASVVQAMSDRFSVRTVSADNTIDAVAADDDDAELLKIRAGQPLLRVRRMSADASGRPIEISDDRYISGSVAFHVHTHADPNEA